MRSRTPLRPVTALVVSLLLAAGAAPARAAGPAGHETPAPGHGALDPVVRLSAQRLLVADEVAAAKWGTGRPIEDPARERQVLDAAAADARRLGADSGQTVRFFRDQIAAAGLVERVLTARWTADPSQAPGTRPALAGIRTALDRLDDRLVHALADTAGPRADPSCGARLAGDSARVAAELRLDTVHDAALARALATVCN